MYKLLIFTVFPYSVCFFFFVNRYYLCKIEEKILKSVREKKKKIKKKTRKFVTRPRES